MAQLHVTDLEAAINWWRERAPVREDLALGPELTALAEVYARLALQRLTTVEEADLPPLAQAAWLAWYASTPDSPCIAICSTAQGDPLCKGCGRSFDEVQHWPAFSPAEKRSVWRRITLEGTAWRFNKYSERAQ